MLGRQKSIVDPDGTMAREEREVAERARKAEQQRERRAKGTCRNKPEHRERQAENAKAKRHARGLKPRGRRTAGSNQPTTGAGAGSNVDSAISAPELQRTGVRRGLLR